MPSIIVIAGSNEGDYYPLGKRVMVVGRDPGCPIQIVDDLVSRKHMQIHLDEAGEAYEVRDLKSANGVFVNARQITTEIALADGDVIEIGNSRLMYTEREFPNRESAFEHYKQRGERSKSTLVR